jgi:hypothetical protein
VTDQPAQPVSARRLVTAPRAATARPAAVLRADGLALAAGSLTVAPGTDKTEGGKRRFLPGRSAGVCAPRLR